jgi:branched-chain amino acid transport system ATP-binding protein
VLEIFPRLAERLNHYGDQLSGGEQQMLAVIRALMTNPKLMILDEATEGLAPLVRKEIWYGLRVLKERGQAILVIDKNLDALMQLADRHYIMEKGQVVWSGKTADIVSNEKLKARYLGV